MSVHVDSIFFIIFPISAGQPVLSGTLRSAHIHHPLLHLLSQTIDENPQCHRHRRARNAKGLEWRRGWGGLGPVGPEPSSATMVKQLQIVFPNVDAVRLIGMPSGTEVGSLGDNYVFLIVLIVRCPLRFVH